MHIIEATSDADYADAGSLIAEYATWLGDELRFDNVAEELADLRRSYGPPLGSLLLAREGSAAAGCVALRNFDPDTCEMKRLYVRQQHRGRGLGRALAEALLSRARALGYRRMVLDTLPRMVEAQALYRALGFREIGSYRPGSPRETLYFSLELQPKETDQ